MNEEAINDGYKYFVETGYQGTIDDYKTLLNTNGDAVNDTYKYFILVSKPTTLLNKLFNYP